MFDGLERKAPLHELSAVLQPLPPDDASGPDQRRVPEAILNQAEAALNPTFALRL